VKAAPDRKDLFRPVRGLRSPASDRKAPFQRIRPPRRTGLRAPPAQLIPAAEYRPRPATNVAVLASGTAAALRSRGCRPDDAAG